MSTYAIVIERSESGSYGAYSPDLPGVGVAAESYEECVKLIREAIEFHLEGLREKGDPVPRPQTVGATTVEAACA